MPQPGRWVPLSASRRLICDLMHFARRVPGVPVQRRMHLESVAVARRRATPRPSWCAVFSKAYALVAADWPELRRAYLPYPWPHLYEHPVNIASMAVERRVGGENAVLFGGVRSPERLSLVELDARIRRLKDEPIGSIQSFRRALGVSRLPLPLRRLTWWLALNASGRQRARFVGTFGVSVYSSLGAESLHPLSPLTTTLSYGVIQRSGRVHVRLVYDHRVLDGAIVARVLECLEKVLNVEILAELHGLAAGQAGGPPRREIGHGEPVTPRRGE